MVKTQIQHSPVKLACGRQLGSILLVTPNNLTVKAVENDEFKQKTWDMKRKQKEYYYQHAEEQNILHTGETVLMFRDGKLKSLLLKS